MSIFPPVVIVMSTYFPDDAPQRTRVAQRAADSWEKYFRYDGELRLHIADDGSRIGNTRKSFRGLPITWTWQDRHGVGASLNLGFRLAFEGHLRAPVVMALMDDWALTESFDITSWVELLLLRPDIGMVRLGPPHPDITGTCRPFTEAWNSWGLLLDRHHYAFGHRPAIYHKRLIDFYGWFKEDCDAYECERDYNERFCSNPNGPDIVLALPHPFLHLDSVELAGVDPRKEKNER